MSTLRCFETNH
jgi:hypothetical protein